MSLVPQIPVFRPSAKCSPYNPAQSVTIAPGSSETIIFRGLQNERYGFNRILFGTNSPSKIRVTGRLNNELTIFQDVHVSAFNNLFLHRSLLAPIIIRNSNTLDITLTNDDASPVEVNVQLAGFDSVALDEFDRFNNQYRRVLPQPTFLYGYTTVSALQVRKQLEVSQKSRDVDFRRMAVGSDGDQDIRVSLSILNDTVRQDSFLEQINNEFLSMQALVPITVGKTVPVFLYLTNKSATDTRKVSFICEAYFK